MSRKPPPPPVGKTPLAAQPKRPPGGATPASRARPASAHRASGTRLPRPVSESFSGLTLPDAVGPDFQDEITIPRRNPYALPTREPDHQPAQPAAVTYAASAAQRPDDVRTAPGVPHAATGSSPSRRPEGRTQVDVEPPEGVRSERHAAQLYDELYDAVNTEVTRTELLWGLTQFAKRRLQSFRTKRKQQRKATLKKLDGRTPQHARPIGMTLGQYVSLLGLPVRLWLLAALSMIIIAGLVAALVVRTDARRTAHAPLPPVALTTPLPSSTPGHPAPTASAWASEPLPQMSLADRAAAGDEEAIAQLTERKPAERTAEESVALERAKVAKHIQSLAEMSARFESRPDLVSDAEWMKTLRAFIAFDRTSADALLVAAGLPGSSGPDLLYDVWTRTGKKATVTKLAQQLVYARDVRTRASPELAVALDLYELIERKDVDVCSEILTVLRSAAQTGDARCLHPLNELRVRTGCGAGETGDCFPCLRRSPLLERATRSVRRRPRPKL